MIRFIYGMMVTIEIFFALIAILLFLITDSRVINIATEDILKEYNIEYQKISGNLFTGIKIEQLKYQNRVLLDEAIVHWNPFLLKRKKIYITQLKLQGLRPDAIIETLSSLKRSDNSPTTELDFDIVIDNIQVTSKPLSYGGVSFKNFQLGSNRVSIDKHFNLRSELFNISLKSQLADLEVRGKVTKKILSLDTLYLTQIDPKVITSFIKEIKKERTIHSDTNSKTHQQSQSNFPLKKITIKNLFATMRTTTYGPITIDNTRATINEIDINPNQNFNYNAKEVTVSSDTSFASSTQKGFIKNSELFTTGDVLTSNYLFERYSLPLNRNELYALPLSLKLNHKGIWLEVEHTVNDLLELENDFNLNLDHAVHKMDYIYMDNFITISSEANGTTHYTEEGFNINNIVNIDFRGEATEVSYHGDITANSISNIPNFISDSLLQNPSVSYHGDINSLSGTLLSNQTTTSFFVEDYKNAKITIESKHDIPLSKLIPHLPYELEMAQGAIRSEATIDFKNIQTSQLHLEIDSNIANVEMDMQLLTPYTIYYNASIPHHSLLSNIDPKIKFSHLNNLSGKVELGEYLYHIEINNPEITLSFDYDREGRWLHKGSLFINGESILFDGDVEGESHAKITIEDINRLSDILRHYYNITLPPLVGSANISIERKKDQSITMRIDSPYLSYDDFSGDIHANVDIDPYHNMHINLDSTQASYQEFVLNNLHGKIESDENKNINMAISSTHASYRDLLIDKIHLKGEVGADKNAHLTLRSNQISHEKFRADFDADISVYEDKSIHVNLNSRQIEILEEGSIKQKINKLSTSFSVYDYGEEIHLNSYAFHLRNNPYIRDIFSNKTSYLSYKNGTIHSRQFWLNDQIEVKGSYHIENQKGKLKLLCDYFPYRDKNFDLVSQFKLNLELEREKIFINGNIKLLGNKISYSLQDSGLSEDSDIIIVQEMKEKKESILNNIKAYVTIENETPIKYETKDINLNLINKITVVKGYDKEVRLLGETQITTGYYIQEDKKFSLDESNIYFYGEPKDSLLEIRANYIKDKYDIQIFISGSSSDPIINFSSNPYLPQRDILSLILFDTQASDSGAGTAVYAMLGGTFAKELMKNLGVSVDHLLLGEGIDESLSLEVGKKISDNMTFILQHKNGKDGVKVKIDHNLNFETDIIIQPPNTSSIEFLYKSN